MAFAVLRVADQERGMKENATLPNIIFVHPTGKGKNKIQHKHTVFEIVEFAEDGWPKLLRLMRDEEVKYLEGGESFMTAYCQRCSLGPWETQKK